MSEAVKELVDAFADWLSEQNDGRKYWTESDRCVLADYTRELCGCRQRKSYHYVELGPTVAAGYCLPSGRPKKLVWSLAGKPRRALLIASAVISGPSYTAADAKRALQVFRRALATLENEARGGRAD